MNTPKRKLGNSGIEVFPLCFGGNVFGWTADEPTSHRLLDGFTDAGLNFIDTADVYSRWVPGHTGGESETIIGKWVQQSGKRGRVIIATKCGMDMGGAEKGLSKAYITRAVEKSLQRLRTDYIDLYQAHKDDPETPLAETMEAFDGLIKAGKVRAVGASNYSADRLAEALRVSKERGLARFETLQPEYNLMERKGYEGAVEELCLRENVGVISYFSLASGFLTGKYRTEADLSKSTRGGRVKNYMNEGGMGVLAALDQIAGAFKATPAQVALAWLVARPSITAPIASATTLDQLKDLIAATQLQLDDNAIQTLNRASA